MALSASEVARYDRQIRLPEIGLSGQLKLKNSRVLVVGTGGLGSPASLYLAAAGVGQIGLMDDDLVSLSNLQRQILFSSDTIQQAKAVVAKNRLSSLNSDIKVEALPFQLSSENISEIFQGYDIIIDATDNFKSRYLISDFSVQLDKPNIYGAVQGFQGQVSVFSHAGGPCYRCIFPQSPPPNAVPNCNENGVLGVVPGMIGMMQATEALKLILEVGESLSGKLLTFDALRMEFSTMAIERQEDCTACGFNANGRSIEFEEPDEEMEASELASRMSIQDPFQLVDVRTIDEHLVHHLEGSIHIPLHELQVRVRELDPEKETILYCHAGIRSLSALYFLKEQGFKNIRHLKGGLCRW